jgi:hypothetical protein
VWSVAIAIATRRVPFDVVSHPLSQLLPPAAGAGLDLAVRGGQTGEAPAGVVAIHVRQGDVMQRTACAGFLELPVPDTPFPNLNDSQVFSERIVDGALLALQAWRAEGAAAIGAS